MKITYWLVEGGLLSLIRGRYMTADSQEEAFYKLAKSCPQNQRWTEEAVPSSIMNVYTSFKTYNEG